jgi:hypothetical protein
MLTKDNIDLVILPDGVSTFILAITSPCHHISNIMENIFKVDDLTIWSSFNALSQLHYFVYIFLISLLLGFLSFGYTSTF